MDLGQDLGHLTYSTLVHPGDTWPEMWNSLTTYVPKVKARVCPDAPFGVSLRLSASSAKSLTNDARERKRLKAFLDEHDLYLYTVNAFPYGAFKGKIVKEDVYEPDWRTDERAVYTMEVANILAEVTNEGIDPTIQSPPLAFKPNIYRPSHVEELSFVGQIRVFECDKDSAKKIAAWFETALQHIGRIGLGKSAGFGKIVSARCSKPTAAETVESSVTLPSDNEACEALTELKLDRPLLADPELIGTNLLKSRPYIPGTMIMGGLSGQLGADAMKKLRIGHALPGGITSTRQLATPLDYGLALGENDDQPEIKHIDELSGRALHISDHKQARSPVKYWTKTRTAIDWVSGTAENEKLFSHAMVVPDRNFTCHIRATDADALMQALNALPQALQRLGRNFTAASIVKVQYIASASDDQLACDDNGNTAAKADTVRIELISDCCLLQPGDVTKGKNARDLYQTYFEKLDPRCTVDRVFTQENWVPPPYAARRKNINFSQDGYMPLLMTRAGSVFYVQNLNPEIVKNIVCNGMPMKLEYWDEKGEAHVGNWAALPWVPENGYGEVRVSAANKNGAKQ